MKVHVRDALDIYVYTTCPLSATDLKFVLIYATALRMPAYAIRLVGCSPASFFHLRPSPLDSPATRGILCYSTVVVQKFSFTDKLCH